MAIANNPTVTDLCTAALKQSGIPTPTTDQVTELAGDGLQNVKTQLWLANPTDHMLESRYYLAMTEGNGYLITPADLDHELYLDAYAGPEAYAGTAQAGTVSSITLAADFSADETAVQGHFIFITGGTGSGQHRQVIAYDDATKAATPNANWLTTPDSTTTYLITTQVRRLLRDDHIGNGRSWFRANIDYPQYYTATAIAPPSGSSPAFRVFPAPDHGRYACVMTYAPNLTLLDESSTIFIKHLRERRALWIQGLKVEAMQRYDDDRFPAAFQIWELLLKRYASHNYTTMQAEGNR